MKPYWSSDDGRIRLYHGDCRTMLPELGLTADLIVADPPYGETSLAWDRWPEGWPAVAATGARSMWCFGSLRMFLDRRDEFRDWRLSQDVIWRKNQGAGFAADRFKRVHETLTHWYRGEWTSVYHDVPRVAYAGPPTHHGHHGLINGGHDRSGHTGSIANVPWVDDGLRLVASVLEVKRHRGGQATHPTQKPIELLDPLLRYGCPSGGLVLDPFAGSCSTGVAARVLGMQAVLIEADEAMCEKAVTLRLSQGALLDGEAS